MDNTGRKQENRHSTQEGKSWESAIQNIILLPACLPTQQSSVIIMYVNNTIGRGKEEKMTVDSYVVCRVKNYYMKKLLHLRQAMQQPSWLNIISLFDFFVVYARLITIVPHQSQIIGVRLWHQQVQNAFSCINNFDWALLFKAYQPLHKCSSSQLRCFTTTSKQHSKAT